MKIISVISTPNPDALKFTVGEELIAEGSRSFTSVAAAEKDKLGSKLFNLEGITSVFYMSNFITINKSPAVSWDVLESQILAVLREFELEEREITEEEKQAKIKEEELKIKFDEMTPAQRILAIDKVLDDEVRPGLAGDGGGIEIVGLEEFTLQVTYEGACGSCPSSTGGTLHYIENTLQSQLDKRLSVVPVS